jgi:hypothetical protein
VKNQQDVKSSDKRTPVEIVNFLICLLCSMMGVASDVMFDDYQKIRLRLAALGFIAFFAILIFLISWTFRKDTLTDRLKLAGISIAASCLGGWIFTEIIKIIGEKL